MALASHIAELKKKHATLSDKIDRRQARPSSSDLEIAELKKQKLRLKEEITRLSS